MGIFGNASPFDEDVEKATSENNTAEQWGLILEICDRAAAGGAAAARGCLRAVLRRLGHADPHVALQAATLLDACVSNCGRTFLLEVASRDAEQELRRVLARAQPPVHARLRALLRKWAEHEFKGDPQLDLIPALHSRLRRDEGADLPAAAPAAPTTSAAAPSAAAAERREQDELARAIALSLQEAAPAAAAAPLYPRVEAPPPAPAAAPARPVRALYDFEAAEDNELTFLAGELVHVTDSSDPNWWKGYNSRGEGLFPANFVSSEPDVKPAAAAAAAASTPAEGRKSVQFATRDDSPPPPPARIDEAALDAALAALHEADPAAPPDPASPAERELQQLERRAAAAAPLVDAALERADRRHAQLTQLSAELVDALNLYHELMREPRPPQPLQQPPPHMMPPQYYMPPGAAPPPR